MSGEILNYSFLDKLLMLSINTSSIYMVLMLLFS